MSLASTLRSLRGRRLRDEDGGRFGPRTEIRRAGHAHVPWGNRAEGG
jgi:hypothetical protein